MRRAPLVLGGTAGGMALLLSYHTSALSITVPQASRAATAGTTPAAGAPPGPPAAGQTPGSDPTTTAPPPSTSVPGTGSPGAPANPAPAAPTPTPTSAPPPAPTTTVGAQTFTGKAVTYQYGVLQVQITDQGGHITNVAEVMDQAADSRSAQINSQAIPRLNQEALQAQSANIQAVSGATYTSDAYMQSLQSAIDLMG